jgi:hypothetical protein
MRETEKSSSSDRKDKIVVVGDDGPNPKIVGIEPV